MSDLMFEGRTFLMVVASVMEQRRLARLAVLKKKMERWDKLTYEEKQRRQRVWKHNSFFGHVAMGFSHMASIRYSSTTTDRAKELSDQIAELLGELQAELKTRIDP